MWVIFTVCFGKIKLFKLSEESYPVEVLSWGAGIVVLPPQAEKSPPQDIIM
jgi:tellurite resistance-related uncharacterized protein